MRPLPRRSSRARSTRWHACCRDSRDLPAARPDGWLPARDGAAIEGDHAGVGAGGACQDAREGALTLAVDDVSYFQANDKYTSVFTADGEALIRTSLRELSDQLDPQRFWQIHRGTIVNVAHVAATSRDLAGRTLIRLKARPETLLVSRAFAHRFRQM